RARTVPAKRVAGHGHQRRSDRGRGVLAAVRPRIRRMSSLRSPLGRVAGLGAARSGVHHWWLQRLTSIALVPLTVWFGVSLLSLPTLDHATVTGWMAQGWTAVLL